MPDSELNLIRKAWPELFTLHWRINKQFSISEMSAGLTKLAGRVVWCWVSPVASPTCLIVIITVTSVHTNTCVCLPKLSKALMHVLQFTFISHCHRISMINMNLWSSQMCTNKQECSFLWWIAWFVCLVMWCWNKGYFVVTPNYELLDEALLHHQFVYHMYAFYFIRNLINSENLQHNTKCQGNCHSR